MDDLAAVRARLEAQCSLDIRDLLAAYDAQAAQIERLATFIMREIPGEPSQSEGAVDTAIRVLGAQAARLAAVEQYVHDHEADLAAGYLSLSGWRDALGSIVADAAGAAGEGRG
jgi:hypothetical protein